MATIGFIGLGVMGQPMAEHLVRAGHEVTVHNRSQGPARALVEETKSLDLLDKLLGIDKPEE